MSNSALDLILSSSPQWTGSRSTTIVVAQKSGRILQIARASGLRFGKSSQKPSQRSSAITTRCRNDPTRFRTSPTRGFAAIGEPDMAVCLLPGTEVAFERDVECDAAFPFMRNRSLKQKVARFRQVNPGQPTRHHDALEFADGQIALVTDLREGQRAIVLQLPAPERAPAGSGSIQELSFDHADAARWR